MYALQGHVLNFNYRPITILFLQLHVYPLFVAAVCQTRNKRELLPRDSTQSAVIK